MKQVKVVAAIIQKGQEYLCVQRGESKLTYISKKWEFPGGKVEDGETREKALIREIKEELKMNITIKSFLQTVEHQYPDFHLIMDCFLCNTTTENVTLTEHLDFKWLSKEKLNSLDWAAADIPVAQNLMLNKNASI